jgi:hypothetical protein
MRVQNHNDDHHKNDAQGLYFPNRVQVEENVSIDLREAQNDIENLEIALVLKIFIGVILAFRLFKFCVIIKFENDLRISRDNNCQIEAF